MGSVVHPFSNAPARGSAALVHRSDLASSIELHGEDEISMENADAVARWKHCLINHNIDK